MDTCLKQNHNQPMVDNMFTSKVLFKIVNQNEINLGMKLHQEIDKILYRGASAFFCLTPILDDLSDYPWIRNLDHLTRINRYRKRVGQSLIRFNDDDMTELALLS